MPMGLSTDALQPEIQPQSLPYNSTPHSNRTIQPPHSYRSTGAVLGLSSRPSSSSRSAPQPPSGWGTGRWPSGWGAMHRWQRPQRPRPRQAHRRGDRRKVIKPLDGLMPLLTLLHRRILIPAPWAARVWPHTCSIRCCPLSSPSFRCGAKLHTFLTLVLNGTGVNE